MRVHLEEGDGAIGADEELARAGADVPDLAQDRLGRGVEDLVLLGREEGRGRLFDELLVSTLQRAVARGDHDDVAGSIRQALRLDVPRAVEVLLDEALPAPERRDRLAGGRVEQLRSEEHTSELQSLMRISYAVFCLKKKTTKKNNKHEQHKKR